MTNHTRREWLTAGACTALGVLAPGGVAFGRPYQSPFSVR
jgi:hypothetical protein